jgi:hypothetical protein
MFPPVNWLHVTAAALAGFTISMIFYSLPIMRAARSEHSEADKPQGESASRPEKISTAILSRLLNTVLYAYAFEWIILQTGISTMGMGILLVLVGMFRAAFTPEGWNRDMIGQSRAVRLLDNLRFILMYVVMTGILFFWK